MKSRFPHSFMIDLREYAVDSREDGQVSADVVLEHLGPRLTPERMHKIWRVVAGRTCDVTPVLENIYDRGNTSAVLRSAEAMGFQCIHVIEPGERFKEANRVTAGADKWLDVARYKNTVTAVADLRDKGYSIFATHLDAKAKPLHECHLTGPIAIVLGNEKDGISPDMQELCDQSVILPMRGFVQSYNISVAAAIAFQTIQLARETAGLAGNLSAGEQRVLAAHYVLRTLDNPARLLREILARV
jgi:tRNA (guanosine-2'-O-)-methyltransferase